MTAYILTFGL